jgi:succinate dehydrogenase / fumarate reductase, cytochrome b subunit
MTWKQLFTSSVGKKIIMAGTGLSLIGFLVVHAGINACIFFNDNGEMFNFYARFMGKNVIVRTMEIGLFAFFILHIVQGLALTFQNRKLRPVGYAVPMGSSKQSKWYSRSMGLLGTLILIFLILHLYHFWVPSRFGGLDETTLTKFNNVKAHNLYAEMNIVFEQWWVVLIYVLACISLAYHLMHGFQSAFRTFGLTNSKYLTLINTIGIGYSVLICALFSCMPLAMYFNWIK